MKNATGKGPTNPSKTIERMEQERASPGSTSAGGHAADAPDNDTTKLPGAVTKADSDASANTAARRGDRAGTDSDAD
jgi:hypothetical protein